MGVFNWLCRAQRVADGEVHRLFAARDPDAMFRSDHPSGRDPPSMKITATLGCVVVFVVRRNTMPRLGAFVLDEDQSRLPAAPFVTALRGEAKGAALGSAEGERPES
ncbi:hypothetical protein [Jiella avicenniae]|uniref:Uncharacterized protein n=1 Tax=Jiella avicenniae TaxID=2907202 RepID=A0A9X1P556_9HYPH|nr:hypothetical protein [Jiella avicenniae]MCE7030698.1 hypothetical protein [Jiella avicenniae]